MYTYGYIREAVLAHIDLSEEEAQAMDVLKRLPIFANEAMQAICAVKPKYYYFRPTIVEAFDKVVQLIYNNGAVEYREATDADEYYLLNNKWPEGYITNAIYCTVADETATSEFYHNKHTYLVGEEVKMDNKFLAFATKQAFILIHKTITLEDVLATEDWTTNDCKDYYIRKPIYDTDYYSVVQNDVLIFHKVGKYEIPCKALWHQFTSGISDEEEIDMPADLLICMPLYIAALVLQIDQAQKAQIKRSEFEIALSRASGTDMLVPTRIKPSYY